MQIKRLKLTALLLAMWLVVGCGVIVTPEVPPTPTLFVMQSLFVEDTCAPPCWFGLTPGVSTSEDVENFFVNNEEMLTGPHWNTYHPIFQGDETNGNYQFNFASPWERPDNPGYSQLTLRDGLVYSISAWINEYVTLEDTLAALGDPSLVRMMISSQFAALHFIYPETRLEVTLYAEREQCEVDNLREDFWILAVDYYSEAAAIEPIERIVIDELQPALYSYGVGDRDVALETWTAWLDGEIDMTCDDAWRELPSEVIYPTVIPSLLITPTATP